MKAEPRRSLAEEGTVFERKLLESARADAIPAASLARLARALSVPSAAPAGTHPPASSMARHGALVKLGACGLIGALAAAAALSWLAPESVAPERSAPSVLEPAVLQAAALELAAPQGPMLEAADADGPAGPPVASTPAGVQPASPVERSAEPTEVAARAAPRRGRSSPGPSVTRETQPSAAETGGLRAELVAVEAIQRALRAGQNGDAERQLADYARRFPRGELALEAELLRIDLDWARGEHARARAHARGLLARADAARYRGRLEALTRDGTD